MAARAKMVGLLVVSLLALVLLPLPVNVVGAIGVVWALLGLRRSRTRRS